MDSYDGGLSLLCESEICARLGSEQGCLAGAKALLHRPEELLLTEHLSTTMMCLKPSSKFAE